MSEKNDTEWAVERTAKAKSHMQTEESWSASMNRLVERVIHVQFGKVAKVFREKYDSEAWIDRVVAHMEGEMYKMLEPTTE